MIDTDYYRHQLGARTLNEQQAIMALRMVLAETEDGPAKSLYWSQLRKEWKGRYWHDAVHWAMNMAEVHDREELRETIFYVLERALPPES